MIMKYCKLCKSVQVNPYITWSDAILYYEKYDMIICYTSMFCDACVI